MSNYKYTSDGKKVVVLGMLNNVESIVQEIFVTASGDEIPSGEKFTSKSLHDAPVVSWAVKEEAKRNIRIEQAKAEIEQLDRLHDATEQKLKIKKTIVESALASIANMPSAPLHFLRLFLSGNAKWTVEDSWYFSKPEKFEETIARVERDYGRERFESLRLLTLYGDTKGNLEFRLSTYGDGSGSSRGLIPFETYEEAIAFIKVRALERYSQNKLDFNDFIKCAAMGISFDSGMVAHYENLLEDCRIKNDIDNEAERVKKKRERAKEYEGNLALIAKLKGEQP